MAQSHPTLFFGTAIFGSSVAPHLKEPEAITNFLDTVHSLGINQLDTAARYPPDNSGESERLIGASKTSNNFSISTKVLLAGTSTDGTLSKEAVRSSVQNSLKTLGIEKISILYAHAPDNVTPLEEQAEAFNEQYENGYCEKVCILPTSQTDTTTKTNHSFYLRGKKIGVSNFPPAMLEKFLNICEERNYVKPSVYQGQYNLINREPEQTLLPLLRKHNMKFVAYSPLAAGFLTGKLTAGNAEGTRLGSSIGTMFRNFYDKPEFHNAIHELNRIIEPLGISSTGAALRWLAYHSELGEEDGIILGASKVEQVVQNVKDIKMGPLPESVLKSIVAIKDAVDTQ